MNSLPETTPTPSLLPAILVGGLLAGVIDAASAIHHFGWGMFYGIASGLLGSKANPAAGGGGPAIWTLGVALHFLIAGGSAAAYCFFSRALGLRSDRFLVGGLMCGIAVFLTMNLVVLPLSAVPFPVGPFKVQDLRLGILLTTLLVGLPISVSHWFFSRRASFARSGADT
ncbi:MAG TPA: hypothetical protein VL200_08280 [Lacunisphaera sp.]|nr:hypothetical protein [Lacunisphaera sp.]